ncbi:MAG: BON domain-containing protein [Gemmatimonadales bacterium]|nr:BON domain-containing protein [Gemmatimonadales bacterium]
MRSGDVELHRRVLAELAAEPSLTEQAARVEGVEVVAESLRLRAPGTRQRIDTEIAHAVAQHLKSHFPNTHGGLKARVERGYVTLEGTVELFHDRNAAEEGTSHLAGVRGVTNLITVKPPELVEDIKSKIEAALVHIAHVDANRIGVGVHGEKVRLRGTVSSYAERREAVKAARCVVGVAEVDDQLQVEAA